MLSCCCFYAKMKWRSAVNLLQRQWLRMQLCTALASPFVNAHYVHVSFSFTNKVNLLHMLIISQRLFYCYVRRFLSHSKKKIIVGCSWIECIFIEKISGSFACRKKRCFCVASFCSSSFSCDRILFLISDV